MKLGFGESKPLCGVIFFGVMSVLVAGGVFGGLKAADAATAAPTFTCASSHESIQNDANSGNLNWQSGPGRVQTRDAATIWCANKSGGLTNGLLEIVGTNNCLAYHTGNYFWVTTCNASAPSMQFTWHSGSLQLTNNYDTGRCMHSALQLNVAVSDETCTSTDQEVWVFNT
jgi:hypothetical protein